MKKLSYLAALVIVLSVSTACAFSLDDLKKGIEDELSGSKQKLTEKEVIAGLKEALDKGTERAVQEVSKLDGYYRNPEIRIPFPERIRKVADTLRKVGLGRQGDEFEMAMNRAAEKAAPMAVAVFKAALMDMTFEDARKILGGGDTAATEYFRNKTSKRLYDGFRPSVSGSMDKVGVTRDFKDLMDKYSSLPFVEKQSVDLDHYVTERALDGLFHMLGQEEKKIRNDPLARTTELLKKVFGN